MVEMKKETEESIQKLGAYSHMFNSILERIEKGEGPSKNGFYDSNLTALVTQYIGENEDFTRAPELDERTLQEMLSRLPAEEQAKTLDALLPKAAKKARKDLVEIVSNEYSNILNKTDNNELYAMLVSTPVGEPKEDSKYKDAYKSKKESDKWAKALEQDNGINEYINSISNPTIKEIIEKYKDRPEVIRGLIEKRAQIYQGRFLENFVNAEKLANVRNEDKQKEIGKALKIDETREYLAANIELLTQEQKEFAYQIAGQLYANYLERKEIEERNEERKQNVKANTD